MKSYLAITGTLFALFAAFHVRATLAAIDQFGSEPGRVFGRAAIALAAGSFAVWAWRLFRSSPR